VRLHYRFIIPLLHIRVLRNWYLLPYLLKPWVWVESSHWFGCIMLMEGYRGDGFAWLDETCLYGTVNLRLPVEERTDCQIKELLYWLSWITDWAESSMTSSQAEEMRDKR
jgi:hypothetical protein